MQRIAVILTVYNRKEVTLRGLRSLNDAIENLGNEYDFDVFMTDDGCDDGTADAVKKEFPMVYVIHGDGNLYWSGGMRKAWSAAVDTGIEYNFFLWFNDDADLYDDALLTMFKAYDKNKPNCIVTGAFCDNEGKPSYGGKFKEFHVLEPNGEFQDVTLMNGNLVLIPFNVYIKLGSIDRMFKHGLGDYDYGLRAQKNGFRVLLTDKYVGICNRHDKLIPKFYSREFGLIQRFKSSYNSFNDPYVEFYFIRRHKGLLSALKFFIARNFYTFFPSFYK